MKRTGENRWAVCHSGHLHRGIYGAAGLLLRYAPDNETPLFLLTEQMRSFDVKVWGLPSGVIKKGESPVTTAHRGAAEGIWPVPRHRVTGVETEDCGGGWQFHLICADVSQLFTVHPVRETCCTGWFTINQMGALPLIRGFRRWVDERVTTGA